MARCLWLATGLPSGLLLEALIPSCPAIAVSHRLRGCLGTVDSVGSRRASTESSSSAATRARILAAYAHRLPDRLHPDDVDFLVKHLRDRPPPPASGSHGDADARNAGTSTCDGDTDRASQGHGRHHHNTSPRSSSAVQGGSGGSSGSGGGGGNGSQSTSSSANGSGTKKDHTYDHLHNLIFERLRPQPKAGHTQHGRHNAHAAGGEHWHGNGAGAADAASARHGVPRRAAGDEYGTEDEDGYTASYGGQSRGTKHQRRQQARSDGGEAWEEQEDGPGGAFGHSRSQRSHSARGQSQAASGAAGWERQQGQERRAQAGPSQARPRSKQEQRQEAKQQQRQEAKQQQQQRQQEEQPHKGRRGTAWFTRRWPKHYVDYEEYAEFMGAAAADEEARRARRGRKKHYERAFDDESDWFSQFWSSAGGAGSNAAGGSGAGASGNGSRSAYGNTAGGGFGAGGGGGGGADQFTSTWWQRFRASGAAAGGATGAGAGAGGAYTHHHSHNFNYQQYYQQQNQQRQQYQYQQQQQHSRHTPEVRAHMRVLGLDASGSLDAAAVKAAFRVKAKETHPDLHPAGDTAGKVAAEERFKAVQQAYQALSRAVAGAAG